MTQTPRTPQEGIADSLGSLSEQTRQLVRQEMDVARQEMMAKARAALPAAALAGGAAVLGWSAMAASYRLGLRLLEKKLPPASAALFATVLYGSAAAITGLAAIRQFRAMPPLFPTGAAQHASEAIADARAQARPEEGS